MMVRRVCGFAVRGFDFAERNGVCGFWGLRGGFVFDFLSLQQRRALVMMLFLRPSLLGFIHSFVNQVWSACCRVRQPIAG